MPAIQPTPTDRADYDGRTAAPSPRQSLRRAWRCGWARCSWRSSHRRRRTTRLYLLHDIQLPEVACRFPLGIVKILFILLDVRQLKIVLFNAHVHEFLCILWISAIRSLKVTHALNPSDIVDNI